VGKFRTCYFHLFINLRGEILFFVMVEGFEVKMDGGGRGGTWRWFCMTLGVGLTLSPAVNCSENYVVRPPRVQKIGKVW
jgi:hypothetical protein